MQVDFRRLKHWIYQDTIAHKSQVMPSVSITGWWCCCRCDREVNSALYGDSCCDCSHVSCSYCDIVGDLQDPQTDTNRGSRVARAEEYLSETPQSPTHKPYELQMQQTLENERDQSNISLALQPPTGDSYNVQKLQRELIMAEELLERHQTNENLETASISSPISASVDAPRHSSRNEQSDKTVMTKHGSGKEQSADRSNETWKSVTESTVKLTMDSRTSRAQRSRASSLDSRAMSMFSTAFSSISESSKSSIQGPQGASERLADILYNDKVLRPLFRAVDLALLDRFERKLRRLFGTFSKDLYTEAQDTKERHVARFVRTQARKLASSIRNELKTDSKDTIVDKDIEAISDSDFGVEDDEMGDFRFYETFILGSAAFAEFKVNLRQFIDPSTSLSKDSNCLTAQEILSVLPFAELDLDLTSSGIDTIRYRCATSFRRILKLKNMILRNAPLAQGRKRVTWTCSCGKALYDDYEELDKGAARRLQRRIRKRHRNTTHTHQFYGPRYITTIVVQTCASIPQALVSTFKVLYNKCFVQKVELPIAELRSESHPSPAAAPQQQTTEQLFLLLCINDSSGNSTSRAHQLPVENIRSDQDLFATFRQYYTSLRTCWWSWASLRQLRHILFVHFEMYDRSLVDVREHDVIPPQELSTVYSYERASLKPPIGSNLLMHYFNCPFDAPSVMPCFRKIPKKLNAKLTVCPVQGVSPGWGLHFVEGLCWERILILSCLIFVIASLGAAILYWKFEHSIQDAFAIGTFVLTAFEIGVGTLQVWINAK